MTSTILLRSLENSSGSFPSRNLDRTSLSLLSVKSPGQNRFSFRNRSNISVDMTMVLGMET